VKPQAIGATVRNLRTELGLTTTALAGKIGVSQAQVSRLEMGEQGFRSDVIARMAKALKVPAFRLFMTDAEWKRWLRKK